MNTPRSALKFDLFAQAGRKRKLEEVGDPLQVIAKHIDFNELAVLVRPFLTRVEGSKGGRPTYPVDVMVRVLVLKQLYNLSDEQMEYQLLEGMSYQRFCLLEHSLNVPDRNTIWRFGQSLGIDGAGALFEGAELQEGQSPDWSQAKARQKDTDATFTKKHGKSYFGYKLSVSLDYKHGFIRGVATGTASEHEGHHFDEVLDTSNTGKQVDTDKGYDSAQRREMLKVLGFKDGIQRKAQKNNHRIAKEELRSNMYLPVYATWAASMCAPLAWPEQLWPCP